jgi:hypothetical protein
MSSIIREKWIWIIISMCILILVGPYVFMWMILQMPDVLRSSFVWFIIFGWGIAAGYKDWVTDTRKRENNSRLQE